ncbi:MAG: segregation/condensation protein A [Halobacteriovoraceae bacterium]|jgi:segregation and condensation protein A|nr:segregation/condensation protein A [Halobacteriovoraceae bacterium]
MLDTSIQVKTDHFDGPLGLLLLLVQKEEMDVRKLDLTKITQQYLTYLSQMRDLNFDVAGDYLYLAATLLLLKSKTAISEDEMSRLKDSAETDLSITCEAELIRRLEELQHFQKMGEKLWGLPKKGHEIFVKPKINRKTIVNSILVPMELDKLTEAMIDFIVKEKRKYTVVRRDKLSIKEKLQFLKSFLKEGEQTDFETLLETDGGKDVDNTVITFISLLELARLKRLTIFQNEGFGTIYVNVIKSLQDFDIESANGFEEEEGNNTPNEEELKEAINQAAAEAEVEETPQTLH